MRGARGGAQVTPRGEVFAQWNKHFQTQARVKTRKMRRLPAAAASLLLRRTGMPHRHASSLSFADIGVPPAMVSALAELGVATPTEIQAKAIPKVPPSHR
jgi:hypothetical protein